ncbi:MAG TPA: carboxypeptidase regulatory-like domain-containing protein, partial [Blastocatellia bacterium]|nr:carboxypeptidase regulatory-like domain-containing protein [Blastocatellia bacterium]
GVITGRVTESDGRPMMGGVVRVTRVDPGDGEHIFSPDAYKPTTDDRGIYRIYGLPPGRYKISAVKMRGVGLLRNSPAVGSNETFHPGVTDTAQAAIVDVKSGSEVTGIDIRIGQPTRTYSARGRVVDASTNRPIPGVVLIVSGLPGADGGRDGTMASPSNERGDFKIDGLTPGRYRAAPFMGAATETDHYGEPIEFEIKTQDVSGLELRMKRGGSISGVVVSEGRDDSTPLPQMVLMTMPNTDDSTDVSGAAQNAVSVAGISRAMVAADGTFRLNGLPPGRLQIMGMDMQSFRRIPITRIEREGLPQPNGIELGAAEQISGVRIVIGSANGTVQGQVRIEGGKLPDTAVLTVSMSTKDGIPWDNRSVIVDSNLQFKFEQVLPGRYSLTLAARDGAPGPRSTVLAGPVSEEVVVQGESATSVTLVLDVSGARPKQN